MNNATIAPVSVRQQTIDLSESLFATLSTMAMEKGKTIKSLLMDIINEAADDYEDAKLYEQACREDINGEGHIMLNEQETAEFEKWLELCR